MAKINQEEYEVLKELDDKWKWIARDKDRGLYAFTEKPVRKYDPSSYWWVADGWDAEPYSAFDLFDEIHLFQFIQWEDEEPYNITELIEEYEYSADHVSHVVNERVKALGNAWKESEEAEVKNIEELKSWFEDDKYYEGEYVNRKIDQLDEPEVLSREWVAEHEMPIYWMPKEQKVVRVEHLQNLLVPKQEEQSAKTVADAVTTFWKSYERLKEVMSMEVEEMEE